MQREQSIKKQVSEVAKYDWKQLEKEYILSDYKSVSAFLKDKQISMNGSTKNKTKGWKNKKVLKQEEKSTKVIEKVLEKESEKEAQQIVDIKSIANDLALNIIKANKQLEKYIIKNKKKTKTIVYNQEVGKPQKEIINEDESIKVLNGIIDRQGLKMLTSALKDLNDILANNDNNNKEDKIDQYLSKLEGVIKND